MLWRVCISLVIYLCHTQKMFQTFLLLSSLFFSGNIITIVQTIILFPPASFFLSYIFNILFLFLHWEQRQKYPKLGYKFAYIWTQI